MAVPMSIAATKVISKNNKKLVRKTKPKAGAKPGYGKAARC